MSTWPRSPGPNAMTSPRSADATFAARLPRACRSGRLRCAGSALGMGRFGLDVVVELELVRVRASRDRQDLAGALVVDPRLDEVGSEDTTLEQEVVVGLERVEHFVE